MKIKSIISIMLLAASLLSACSGNIRKYNEPVSLKVSIGNKISYAPIFIAEAEGYFTEYGFKIEYVTTDRTSLAINLLVSGDVDVYTGILNIGFLNVEYVDKNIKAVADRGHLAPGKCTDQAILIRKDLFESGKVTGPKDLKGLTFSSSPTGVGAYTLSIYLSQAGLTFKDIKTVSLDTPSELGAYANKSIDGGYGIEPDLSRYLDSGEVVILAGFEDIVGTFQTGIIAFNKKLLVDNPEIGARFLAAYLKGVRRYNEGKTARNLQILAKATGETAEALQKMCWAAINNDGVIEFAGVDKFQQWAIAQGNMDNPVTEDQFWDPSLLVKAQRLLNP